MTDELEQAVLWRQVLLAQLTVARNELITALEQAPATSLERIQIAKAVDACTRAAHTTQMNIDVARQRITATPRRNSMP